MRGGYRERKAREGGKGEDEREERRNGEEGVT